MERNTDRKSRLTEFIFAAFVFAAMLIFFERAHKLVILDIDDWAYIAQSRIAVPSLRFWNPARILPETLMPLCSQLAALIIMPLCGDYIHSLTIMNGLVISVFITVYIHAFYRLLTVRFSLESHWAVMAALMFLLFHFWVYRTQNSDNSYVFMSRDVTCIYYYVIPTLLNASLVMLFAVRGTASEAFAADGYVKNGLLILTVYLAVFSNLFSSIVLAAYMGVAILRGLISAVKMKKAAPTFLKDNIIPILTVLLWLVSVVFEGLGERGEGDAGVSFAEGLRETAAIYPGMFTSMNKIFLLLCAGLIAAAVVTALLRRDRGGDFGVFALELLCCFAISSLFLVLLCAKVEPYYIGRIDVVPAMLFFFFAFAVLCGAYAVKHFNPLGLLLPLLLYVALSDIVCPMKTFQETNVLCLQPEIAEEIDRALVEQAVNADKAGLREAELHVMYFGEDSDWPYGDYIKDRLPAALYKHGIISHMIDFTVVPDLSVNDFFKLYY